MGGQTLPPDEQRAYDELKMLCHQQPMLSLPKAMQYSCALLDQQLKDEAAFKKAEAERLLAQRQNEARDRLTIERLKAVTYTITKVHARQAEATLLLAALIQASGAYDQILAARAAKPFLFEAILGVGLAFLPELKIIGKTIGRFLPKRGLPSATAANFAKIGAAAERSAATSWEALADELAPVVKATVTKQGALAKGVLTFGQALDAASNDAIQAVRQPLMASSDADADTKTRMAGYAAKNQIMSQILTSISRSLWASVKFEPVVYYFIFWYEGEDVLSVVTNMFKRSGLDEDMMTSPQSFDRFSDIILYDMLRAYVKSYFVVLNAGGRSPDDLPQHWPEGDIEGLDPEQRKMIYAKFSKMDWYDPTRPPVKDYRDFLSAWGGNTTVPKPREGKDYIGHNI